MRNAAMLLTMGAFACSMATAPVATTVHPQSGADATFSCVLRELNTGGYTVTTTDRPGGLIRAEMQIRGAGPTLAGIRAYRVLHVSVYDDNGRTALRITPALEREPIGGTGRSQGEVRREENEAAAAIAATCAG